MGFFRFMLTQLVRVFKRYIYADMKKIYFRVTLVKITPSARAGVTGKMPVKSGWSVFFAISWGILNSTLTSDFVRCLKCKHTVGGILEHSFCLVRLMECINLVSECYWISNAILWRFLESYTNWVGPLRTTWIRWVLLDTSPLYYWLKFVDIVMPSRASKLSARSLVALKADLPAIASGVQALGQFCTNWTYTATKPFQR